MKADLKVEQGRFRLAAVDVMCATKDLLVVEVDCDSKYPGAPGIAWGGEDGPRVDIWPRFDGEQRELSLHLDESTHLPSRITLPKYTDGWIILTDARRYTVRIVAYKQRRRSRRVWESS